MVSQWGRRNWKTTHGLNIFYGGLWNILTRLTRIKRKLALSIKRHILLVFLLSILTIAMLYLQCLQHPETCIAALLTSKYRHFTKRSNKQVKCPWDYFIQNYNPAPPEIKMKAKNRKSFLSSLKLFGLLSFLKNSSYLTNKQSEIINSSIIMATFPSISKNDSEKHPNSLSEENNFSKFQRNSSTYLDPNYIKLNSSSDAKIIINKPGCEPLFPHVLLYNRIPKTGSTTMSYYFENCSKALDVPFRRDSTEEWSNEILPHPIVTRIEQQARQRDRRNQRRKRHIQRAKGLFIVAHFYFRKYLNVPINYTYINLLRDPVERYISHYYYARSPSRWPKKLKNLKKLGHFNETLEQCLAKQHEGCEWNHMTRFFCGPELFCKNGSGKGLERAKYNMEHYYASVGVLENLTDFIHVLHRRLPGFVIDSPRVLGKTFVTKGVKKERVSDAVMKKIIEANKADIELYEYAKMLFKKQAKACGIKITT